MPSALKKISTRAKQLQKKHPNTKWTSLIKRASKDYRTGKLGSVTKKKKNSSRQTGTSNKNYDQQRTARPPGPRKPAGGKKVTYYERRKNRSDKPGSLTGGMKSDVKQKLSRALLDYELATTIKATDQARERIKKYRKVFRSL